MLQTGIRGEARTTVSGENTAAAHASGALPVFATPAMIGLKVSSIIRIRQKRRNWRAAAFSSFAVAPLRRNPRPCIASNSATFGLKEFSRP